MANRDHWHNDPNIWRNSRDQEQPRQSWNFPETQQNQRRSRERHVPVDFNDFQAEPFPNRSPPRQSRSPGFDRVKSRSPTSHRSRSPRGGFSPRGSRRSFSPQRNYSRERSPGPAPRPKQQDQNQWWNHNPNDIVDGTIKEYIDDFTGLIEVDRNGENLTAFFHATAIWLVNHQGNPYGAPVKFTEVLGQNTATTRENTGITLMREAPIGTEVLLHVLPVQSEVVQFVVLFAWPKSTEVPPRPTTDNEQKILEKKQEYFLKEFHNKLENLSKVDATFPGCIRSLYPDIHASVWEIKDENYGIIELRGERPVKYRFFALFHKEDVWLRDGKHGLSVDFFKHKPLQEMCKVGQPVNLVARSIVTTKGVNLTSAVLELQAVVVSLNPDIIPPSACRPTWNAGPPGVFSDANRSCTYFNNELFEKLNVQLRNFLHKSGKKYPHIDPKLIESGPMLNPAQIKREHFEAAQIKKEQFEAIQVKKEQFETYQFNQQQQDPYSQQQGSIKLMNVSTKVIRHLTADTAVVEGIESTWKCLVFLDHVVRTPGFNDIRMIFPVNSHVQVNCQMVAADKAIQYIATLAWNQISPMSPNEPDRVVSDIHYQRFHSAIDTMGRVIDTVSNLNVNKSKDLLLSKHGKVKKILDQNFGILEIDEGLVLFDTCDFYMTRNQSADNAQKALDDVVGIGTRIMTHACLIDPSLKIPYLATSVWVANNPFFTHISQYPNPIQKKDIHQQKIENFRIVVDSVKDSIEEMNAVSMVMDPKDLLIWCHARVRVTFYDKGYKEHGSMICGLVEIDGAGIGFFMSKSFAKVDAVPTVGMQEYVNAFPCHLINPKNPKQYASIDFICTNLYPTYLSRESAAPPLSGRLEEIVKESCEMLLAVIAKYPQVRDPMDFIRVGNLINAIDICNQVQVPKVPEAVVQTAQAINQTLKQGGSNPTQQPTSTPQAVVPKVENNEFKEQQIEIEAAYLRCMIDETSGVLKYHEGTVEKLCYFEMHDLNIDKPYQLLDVVMLMNRMNGIRVQFQARLVDAKARIQYVAHMKGVQIIGKMPAFMSHIKIRNQKPSTVQAGLQGEKVQRYRKANDVFARGKYKTISDLLSMNRRGKDYVQGIGYIKQLLNENFGIVEIGKDFALFDTFDLYIKDGVTAADSKKPVTDVLKVNDKVCVNACFIREDLPMTHLATSVWLADNTSIKKPEGALTKNQIAADKLSVFEQVSNSCAKLLSSSKLSDQARLGLIDKVYRTPKYKEYIKKTPKSQRRTGDPLTPDVKDNHSQKEFMDHYNVWKTSIEQWHEHITLSNKSLLAPALKDFDNQAGFDRPISQDYGILNLFNGKKAFVHLNRIWINKGPIYGGFRCLQGPTFKKLSVNARSITPIHGVSYQVTFCHSGMNHRDFKKKEYVYPDQMKAWIDRVVDLDKLNDELKQFTTVFEKGFK